MKVTLEKFARVMAQELLKGRFETNGDELGDTLFNLGREGWADSVTEAEEGDLDTFLHGVEDLMRCAERAANKAVEDSTAAPAAYESKEHNDDPYNRCNTEAQFASWVTDCGWKDAAEFESDTGVTFEELRGVWFNVTHNRVFTLVAQERSRIVGDYIPFKSGGKGGTGA